MLIALIVVGLVGALLVVLGYLIWKKITLLHDYNYYKVSAEDKRIFAQYRDLGFLLLVSFF